MGAVVGTAVPLAPHEQEKGNPGQLSPGRGCVTSPRAANLRCRPSGSSRPQRHRDSSGSLGCIGEAAWWRCQHQGGDDTGDDEL